MTRSAAAVSMGFAFIVILSFGADSLIHRAFQSSFDFDGRVKDPAITLLVLAYVAVFAVAGCYLTARLAPDCPMRHALMLGALGLAFSIPGTLMTWRIAPAWYHIFSLIMIMPYAWLGGWLGERHFAVKQKRG